MRPEKEFLTREYAARLNASPFFIVVNYKGLHVAHMTELRRRLSKAGAEVHVVKNSIFRIAAKVVKSFGAEFDKLKIHFGYLNNQRLEQADLLTLADLPSMEVLRGKLLGLFNAPATKFVTLLNTPASQLARVLKAQAEKLEKAAPAPAPEAAPAPAAA